MSENPNPTEARQGRTGQKVRYVLIASIVLAAIALIIVFGVVR